jgi:hypothetical protein
LRRFSKARQSSHRTAGALLARLDATSRPPANEHVQS